MTIVGEADAVDMVIEITVVVTNVVVGGAVDEAAVVGISLGALTKMHFYKLLVRSCLFTGVGVVSIWCLPSKFLEATGAY
jgi:hypothetical protein